MLTISMLVLRCGLFFRSRSYIEIVYYGMDFRHGLDSDYEVHRFRDHQAFTTKS